MSQQKKISPLKQALKSQRKNLFRNGRYWFHVLIWLIAACYLSFEILGDAFDSGVKDGMKTASTRNTINSVPISHLPAFYICIFTTIAAAIMVYSFLLFFIPYARFNKQKRYLWIGVISNFVFWITIIVITAMMLGITTEGHDGGEKKLNKDNVFLSGVIATVFSGIVAGGFFALYYFIDLYDQSKQLSSYKEALTKRIEAETAFLLHQINPHFLFNTLNNIYALLLSQSADAVFITKELKNMTQYILEDCSKEKVKLTDEITFLKNYINLEKLRNREDKVSIRLIVNGDAEGREIAPLLLINFLENAFKHGVKAGYNESYVSIVLEIKANKFTLQMENSKPPASQTENQDIREDSGIGIANVKRRLDILYPGHYKLAIQDNPNEYLVLLSIDL